MRIEDRAISYIYLIYLHTYFKSSKIFLMKFILKFSFLQLRAFSQLTKSRFLLELYLFFAFSNSHFVRCKKIKHKINITKNCLMNKFRNLHPSTEKYAYHFSILEWIEEAKLNYRLFGSTLMSLKQVSNIFFANTTKDN